MSFDAFMTRAASVELQQTLYGARVEKVLQPSKDEIFLLLHRESRHFRLQMNASPAAPRFGLTGEAPENPQTPPMFCMLLRKHLTGSKVTAVCQLGFERAIKITFETYDELGFFTERHIICEIMGRCSNIILCENAASSADNGEVALKILACARPVDFTTSRKRQLLPGMRYELPPSQEKLDPFQVTREEFLQVAANSTSSRKEMLTERFLGFSPLLSRELAYRADGKDDPAFADLFFELIRATVENRFAYTLVTTPGGDPIEFSCFEVTCYENAVKTLSFPTSGELTDSFFAERERIAREKSRGAETARLLSNLEKRISKKLKAQRSELKEAENGDNYRRDADLITANIYQLKRGDKTVTLTDYSDCREDGSYGLIAVTLDPMLTPSQNAQRLYKKYAKSKAAREHLAKQILAGEEELTYIRSVTDALNRINGQSDLDEIRAELTEAGYIRSSKQGDSNKKSGKAKSKKPASARPPKKYLTPTNGLTVLVGRNNTENDRLTFRTALKTDIWFHVKNVPGSHTILLTDGNTVTDKDIEEAATIAAINSSAAGEEKVAVDYTLIKNVKKPSGAKPGFVIYTTYKQIIVPAK
ncbi:MAG: NFACT family protein [Clostridia bacterium]|nr:NFACT family protein [Clostridia bacterium]